METKALGQLHFKYYAEVKETQNVKGRQVPRCLFRLWKEVCFPALPGFQTVRLQSVCSSLVFQFKYVFIT